MNIRVLLADDHQRMRDSLRSLIDKQPGMEVVAEADNVCKALRFALKFKPDILLMDINMAGLRATDAVRHLISECPCLKFIALSIYPNREFVGGMLKAGACGYLLKDCAFEELIPAIHSAFDNKPYLCAGLEKEPDQTSG